MRSSFFLEREEIPITWGIAGDNGDASALANALVRLNLKTQ